MVLTSLRWLRSCCSHTAVAVWARCGPVLPCSPWFLPALCHIALLVFAAAPCPPPTPPPSPPHSSYIRSFPLELRPCSASSSEIRRDEAPSSSSRRTVGSSFTSRAGASRSEEKKTPAALRPLAPRLAVMIRVQAPAAEARLHSR